MLVFADISHACFRRLIKKWNRRYLIAADLGSAYMLEVDDLRSRFLAKTTATSTRAEPRQHRPDKHQYNTWGIVSIYTQYIVSPLPQKYIHRHRPQIPTSFKNSSAWHKINCFTLRDPHHDISIHYNMKAMHIIRPHPVYKQLLAQRITIIARCDQHYCKQMRFEWSPQQDSRREHIRRYT